MKLASSPDLMDVGRGIRLIRTSLSLAQGKLAKRVGISASYLSLIEKGRREPTLPLLRRIAKELDISPAILLAVSRDPKRQPTELKRLNNDFSRLVDILINLR
jgi:transcriptional regulator with XRE-family HTH domain